MSLTATCRRFDLLPPVGRFHVRVCSSNPARRVRRQGPTASAATVHKPHQCAKSTGRPGTHGHRSHRTQASYRRRTHSRLRWLVPRAGRPQCSRCATCCSLHGEGREGCDDPAPYTRGAAGTHPDPTTRRRCAKRCRRSHRIGTGGHGACRRCESA